MYSALAGACEYSIAKEGEKGKRGENVKKSKNTQEVQVKITFTKGYEERFTMAILKMYTKRLRREEKQQRAVG